MEFDWPRAIERNGEILCGIAARLIVMAGIEAGRTVETLPRHLYLRILALLRPAEYAARRLIAMAACRLDLKIGSTGSRPDRDPSSPLRGEVDVPCEAKLGGSANRVRGHAAPRPPRQMRLVRHKPSYPLPVGARTEPPPPAFRLFDPLKPFGDPWLTPAEIAALADPGDSPPFVPASPPPNEPVDARALARRIRALAGALSDLDRQALRLARWRARRAAGPVRPMRWSPMRPGRPPGWKRRPKTEIEEVLKECHFLALDAWDTS